MLKSKSKRLRGGKKGVFCGRIFYKRFVFVWRTLNPAFYVLYSIKNCTSDGGKKDSFFVNSHNCFLPPDVVLYTQKQGKDARPGRFRPWAVRLAGTHLEN